MDWIIWFKTLVRKITIEYLFQVRINGPPTNYDAAMLQFEQLINNKNFILNFIETLEAQKSFNIRDK